MNPTIELNFWLRLLGILALEISLVVALAFAAQALTQSAFWRRTIWQSCLVCLLLLVASEISGVGRGVAVWFAGKPPVERKISVRIVPVEEQFIPAPVENGTAPPMEFSEKEMPIAHAVWWPGILWLAGLALIIARILFARILFVTLRWRKTEITDVLLLNRVSDLALRLGIRRKIHLLESSGFSGPMTFGIAQSCIGLPRGFAQNFSAAEQNAMLTHELAHVAARDPFWYLLADLTSALLWWHPLVWLARRRLHSASELAADEAAAILENGPGTLAECLVNLGQRLTKSRSFGWLGVDGNGFRSHLAQRVERLLNLKTPKKNKLRGWPLFLANAAVTIFFAGLIVFTSGWIQNGKELRGKNFTSAVQKSWDGSFAAMTLAALSVEKAGPIPTTTNKLTETVVGSVNVLQKTDGDETAIDKKIATATLVQDGKLLLEMGKLDDAEAILNKALKVDPENKRALYYKSLVKEAKAKVTAHRPPRVSPSGNSVPRTNLAYTSKGRQTIKAKLDRIRLKEVQFENLPLGEVLKMLRDESKKGDPDKRGINFVFNPHPVAATNNPAATPAFTVLADPYKIIIQNRPPLENVRLADVLDSIVHAANKPIEYTITDYAVVFSPKTPEANALYIYGFKLNPKVFMENLEKARSGGPSESKNQIPTSANGNATNLQSNINLKVRNYFAATGVDFGPIGSTTGKSVVFNDKTGLLMVRATMDDLQIIQTAIETLTHEPPQVTVEAKFMEVSEAALKKLGRDFFSRNGMFTLTNQTTSSDSFLTGTNVTKARLIAPENRDELTSAVTGILNDLQCRIVLRALEEAGGVDILAAPKVTTLSGRQTQIFIQDAHTVINVPGLGRSVNTNIISTNGFWAENVLTGPVLDVLPTVSADGFAIELALKTTVTEFLGYDKGDHQTFKPTASPKPRARVRAMKASVSVWDGQTVMLSQEDKNESVDDRKHLFVFVTPTIIDPAGNRVHGEELPFTTNSVPKQAERK